MLRGELYLAADAQLIAEMARAQELLERYNATRDAERDERAHLLRELLGEVGEGVVIKLSFRCDYGTHISIGAGTFVNYDCVMLDVAPIRIAPPARWPRACSC
jgi:maltose O-acetyltransferase